MARVPGPPRTLNSRNNLANAYPEAVRILTGKLTTDPDRLTYSLLAYVGHPAYGSAQLP